MAERDYANDYTDWLNAGGRDGTGQEEPWRSPGPGYGVPTQQLPPNTTPQPIGGPTTAPPTGRHPNAGPPGSNVPNMDPEGYMGGYWGDNGQWVQGSPRTPGGGGGSGYSGFGGGGGAGAGDYWSNFQWPQFAAPTVNFGQFKPRAEFQALSPEEAMNEPGLAFGIKEGRKQIENSAAARGTLRSGMTLKDIFDWTNNRALQGYDSANQRKFNIWNANNDLDFRTYGTNRDTAFGSYDRNYNAAKDQFDFNQFQPSKLKFEDEYRRYKAGLDAALGIYAAGAD